jgi:PAS domain S-box-containing protein
LWNSGAEEMFGWTATEAVGQSMDRMIPEKHRARHWESYPQRAPLAFPANERGINAEDFLIGFQESLGKFLQRVSAARLPDGRESLHAVGTVNLDTLDLHKARGDGGDTSNNSFNNDTRDNH